MKKKTNRQLTDEIVALREQVNSLTYLVVGTQAIVGKIAKDHSYTDAEIDTLVKKALSGSV